MTYEIVAYHFKIYLTTDIYVKKYNTSSISKYIDKLTNTTEFKNISMTPYVMSTIPAIIKKFIKCIANNKFANMFPFSTNTKAARIFNYTYGGFTKYYKSVYVDRVMAHMIGINLKPKLYTADAISNLIYTNYATKTNDKVFEGMTMIHLLCYIYQNMTTYLATFKFKIQNTIYPLISYLLDKSDLLIANKAGYIVLMYNIPILYPYVKLHINYQHPDSKSTLMKIALYNCDLEYVKLLMDFGYDKTLVDCDGNTAADYIPDIAGAEAFHQLLD